MTFGRTAGAAVCGRAAGRSGAAFVALGSFDLGHKGRGAAAPGFPPPARLAWEGARWGRGRRGGAGAGRGDGLRRG